MALNHEMRVRFLHPGLMEKINAELWSNNWNKENQHLTSEVIIEENCELRKALVVSKENTALSDIIVCSGRAFLVVLKDNKKHLHEKHLLRIFFENGREFSCASNEFVTTYTEILV